MPRRKPYPPDEPRTFDLEIEESGGGARLTLSGRLALTNAERLRRELEDTAESTTGDVSIDVSAVDYLDAAGAAVLIDLERDLAALDRRVTFLGVTARAGVLKLIDRKRLISEHPGHIKPEGVIAQIGGAAIAFVRDVHHSIGFVGESTIGMMRTARKPSALRIGDVLHYMERTGADALPIVGLISILMGLILGFQALMQLKQFGANIYAADLVGLSILRELGPLMTCILVAGRSGSAFAAEIGTMMVSEEVDALTSMGFDPIRFLVVPKIIALALMVPVLIIYSDFLGLLGGLIVGTTVGGLTISAYVQESVKTIDLWDIGQGLVKGQAYALIIAVVGCMRGFQVRGGAASVGQYTTSAVVTSIFLLIVTDAIFTLIFQYWEL
ncbi:MlaE family lipid ABC transporter permease subunit [bacterium]|nr:MlaE family lipid ABC transporter permease subunit [bacterium]